ncbi:MAG: MBL fold metallo-hydrolase [Bernardetiaceae bacterium]
MIHTLDLHFLDVQEAIGSFLVETSAGAVLVESGPYSTYPHLLEALKNKGLSPADISHVFLTHIHFDHAGAAWALAQAGATILVHPFGYKHIIQPDRLYESARRIYGDDMDRLWGKMEAIAPQQLIAVEDGEEILVGNTVFKAHHTPGHASHHIAWQVNDVVFAGDVAGVKIGTGPVVPPCPPPDISVEDWQKSIQKLIDLKPASLYLTHFDRIPNPEAHLRALEENLLTWANWIKPHFEQGTPPDQLTPLFQDFARKQLEEAGVSLENQDKYEKANPAWMSVAGLLRYWKKKNA